MFERAVAEGLPSADVCEAILRAALSAGDMRGVEAALTLLAVQDGPRAQEMVDVLRLGLDLAEHVESTDLPGCMDASDVHYAVTRDGGVPHLYRGTLPPGAHIGRPAVCGVVVVRLAHPSETASGRLCRRCEQAEAGCAAQNGKRPPPA